MKTVELQSSIVYGPVESRRFGYSLGVNILPVDFRLCTFDCVYCQYRSGAGKGKAPTLEEIYVQATADFERIRDSKKRVDWIMIAGNGEPTLHPDFPEVVEGLMTLRELHFPKTPVGILSNSSTCCRPEVRATLLQLDGRFMKLDAGNLYMFHDVNRPRSMMAWGEVIEGLQNLPDITLQSMFVTGRVDNTGEKEVGDWIDAVQCVRPREVQIYTIDRTPQEADVLPVEDEKLMRIADRLRRNAGVSCVVYV